MSFVSPVFYKVYLSSGAEGSSWSNAQMPNGPTIMGSTEYRTLKMYIQNLEDKASADVESSEELSLSFLLDYIDAPLYSCKFIKVEIIL